LTDETISSATPTFTLSSWGITGTLTYLNASRWAGASITSNDYFTYDGATGNFNCL